MRGTRSLSAVVVSVACALGCTTSLRLGPTATAIEGRGIGAVASHEGVEVEARVEAWAWEPVRLDRTVTPVLVKIRNASERPIRVRYKDFALRDTAGRAFAALPPFDIDADVGASIPAYTHGGFGFHLAPHLGRYYPHARLHRGAFAHRRTYYSLHYPRLRAVALPTTDMLAHALPEGVVEPRGRAAGFVYFEQVVGHAEGDAFDFRFLLVDAKTEQAFGEIALPFRIHSGFGARAPTAGVRELALQH